MKTNKNTNTDTSDCQVVAYHHQIFFSIRFSFLFAFSHFSPVHIIPILKVELILKWKLEVVGAYLQKNKCEQRFPWIQEKVQSKVIYNAAIWNEVIYNATIWNGMHRTNLAFPSKNLSHNFFAGAFEHFIHGGEELNNQ